MSRIKFVLITLCVFSVLLAQFQLFSRFDYFFEYPLKKIIALMVILYLTYVFIYETVQAARNKFEMALSRLIMSLLMISISFYWISSQYVCEIQADNIAKADSLFDILISLLILTFYLLARYTFSKSEMYSLSRAING